MRTEEQRDNRRLKNISIRDSQIWRGIPMTVLLRRLIALFLCVTIGLPGNAGGDGRPQPARSRAEQKLSLREYLQKSYLELFELAPTLEFTQKEIESQREALKKGKDICVERFENHTKRYSKQIDA